MTISVTIDGADELIAQLAKIGKQSGPAMTKIANATAIELKGNIIKKISGGTRTGHLYTHYMATIGGNVVPVRKRAKPHRASAPGEAPKTDSGRLVGLVYFDKARGTFGSPTATVGSKLAYALYLEYGTRNMKPRPVWEPEAKKAQAKFIKRVENYLSKVTR